MAIRAHNGGELTESPTRRNLLCNHIATCYIKKPLALRDALREAFVTGTITTTPIEITKFSFSAASIAEVDRVATEKGIESPKAGDLSGVKVTDYPVLNDKMKLLTRSNVGFRPTTFVGENTVKFGPDGDVTGVTRDIKSTVNSHPAALGAAIYGLGANECIIGITLTVVSNGWTYSMVMPLFIDGEPIKLDFSEDHEWGGSTKGAAEKVKRIHDEVRKTIAFMMNPANIESGAVEVKKKGRKIVDSDSDSDEEVDHDVESDTLELKTGKIVKALGDIKTVADLQFVPKVIGETKENKKSRGKKGKEDHSDDELEPAEVKMSRKKGKKSKKDKEDHSDDELEPAGTPANSAACPPEDDEEKPVEVHESKNPERRFEIGPAKRKADDYPTNNDKVRRVVLDRGPPGIPAKRIDKARRFVNAQITADSGASPTEDDWDT